MARKTSSRRNTGSPKKTLPKSRSQKMKSKPKTPPKLRKNSTKKQKTVKRPKSNSQKNAMKKSASPRMFESELQSMYQRLEYPNSDSMKSNRNVSMIKRDGSIDLFETDSIENVKQETPVQMISIGIQCSLEVEKRDFGTSTDAPRPRDMGMQTSPLKISHKINKLDFSIDEDEFDEFSEETDDSSSEEESSDDLLKNFDALEHLDDEDVYVPNANESDSDEGIFAETKSTISESPPRNQIYTKETFHSPESHAFKCK